MKSNSETAIISFSKLQDQGTVLAIFAEKKNTNLLIIKD